MLNLFRIIQEALQNSVKHSGVKNIDIKFLEIEGIPSILIVDVGKGFDTSKVTDGNGLENMKKRSELSNAEIKITSGHDGTTILVKVLSI